MGKLCCSFLFIFLIAIIIDSIAWAQDPPEAGYRTSALERHNLYRKRHSSPKLKLSTTLNAAANKCAAYYAKKGNNDHSCPYKGNYGENLNAMTQSQGKSIKQMLVETTDLWYSEGSDYDYNKPVYNNDYGHFTQLVWKDTKLLGLGVAPSKNGFMSIVALYSPAGNVPGEFKQNVLRPKKASSDDKLDK